MNANERFEIMAEAFYRMTRRMAPGKSVPMEMASTCSYEERSAAWEVWNEAYSPVIHAMLDAFQVVMQSHDED